MAEIDNIEAANNGTMPAVESPSSSNQTPPTIFDGLEMDRIVQSVAHSENKLLESYATMAVPSTSSSLSTFDSSARVPCVANAVENIVVGKTHEIKQNIIAKLVDEKETNQLPSSSTETESKTTPSVMDLTNDSIIVKTHNNHQKKNANFDGFIDSSSASQSKSSIEPFNAQPIDIDKSAISIAVNKPTASVGATHDTNNLSSTELQNQRDGVASIEITVKNDSEDIEQLPVVENGLNVKAIATPNRLDSERISTDDKLVGNSARDCDSSDILIENEIKKSADGAISDKTNAKNENSAETSIIEKCKIVENVKQCEENVKNESNNNEMKQNSEQMYSNIELNNGAKKNCSSLCSSDPIISNETKKAFDLTEDVASVDGSSLRFMDKFKKSFGIMEKSKLELNSAVKKVEHESIAAKTVQNSGDKKPSTESKSLRMSASRPPLIVTAKEHKHVDSLDLASVSARPPNTNSVLAEHKNNECCDLSENSIKHKQRDEQEKYAKSFPCGNSVNTNHTFSVHENANNSSKHSSYESKIVTAANNQKNTDDNSYPKIAAERTIIVSPKSELRLKPNINQMDALNFASINTEPKSKTNSLYVNNPDFSKQLRPTMRDLSPLRMKAPDFSKISRSTELHCSNPDFTKAYDKLTDAYPQPHLGREVNPSNFAEISKKYNYISDLQLKNPLPTSSKANEQSRAPSSSSSSSSSLYVKPPHFGSKKLRTKIETETVTIEEPTAHIIHKSKYRIQADSSSKPAVIAASPIHNEFPQISQDVTMSIVPQSQSQIPSTKPPQANQLEQHYQIEVHSGLQANLYGSTYHRQHELSHNSMTTTNPYSAHPEKGMPNMHKAYSDELLRRNSTTPTSHQQQQQQQHAFHASQHRDTTESVSTKPAAQYAYNYENYRPNEKRMPMNNLPPEMVSMRQATDVSIYSRHQASNQMPCNPAAQSKTMHYAHTDSQPSTNNSNIHSFNYLQAKGSNSQTFAKTIDYHNQMNPPPKWPSQTRITQSPISSASSPHSISSQSTRVSQSPISASPLPHQQHRQSPSNLYPSPHATPSPSPFGYPPAPSPVSIKHAASPLSSSVPLINIPSPHLYHNPESTNNRNTMQLKHYSDYLTPIPNSGENKYMQNSVAMSSNQLETNFNEQKGKSNKVPDTSRYKDVSRDNHTNMRTSSQQRLNVSSKHSTKTEASSTKYADLMQYKVPNTIVDPFVYRQSSEADLNYQIIKKTLNKEIPTPSFNRQNANRNFNLPDRTMSSRPPTNSHQLQKPNESNVVRKDRSGIDSRPVYLDNKTAHVAHPARMAKESEHKMQFSSQYSAQQSRHPPTDQPNYESRTSTNIIIPTPNASSGCNSQYLSSAMQSNVQKQLPTNSALQNRLPTNSPQQQNSVSPLTAPAVTNHPNYEVSAKSKRDTRTKKPTQTDQSSNLAVNTVSSTRSPSSTLFGPTKRESPLDLSVKTVKTKADSTGVYDYSLPSRRHEAIPQSLKVDFAPNFASTSTSNNRSQRKSNDLSASATSVINHVPSNRPQLTSQPLQQAQPSYSHTEYQHQQRMFQYNETPSSYMPSNNQIPNTHNTNSISDPRCKEPSMERNLYPPKPTANGPSATANESKVQNEAHLYKIEEPKMPLIFGQKPEELKNFSPQYQAYQADIRITNQKGNVNLNTNNRNELINPMVRHCSTEREQANHVNPMDSRPGQFRPVEYSNRNEIPLDVIQLPPHLRQQHTHKMHGTLIAGEPNKQFTISNYPYDIQRAPSQLVNPMQQSNFSYSNQAPSDKGKISHRNLENNAGNDFTLSAATETQRKRAAESIEAYVPMKQSRYEPIRETKGNENPQSQYYDNRDVPNHASYYPGQAKFSNEKPFNLPVIVKPPHLNSNDVKYQYNQNTSSESNPNAQQSDTNVYQQKQTPTSSYSQKYPTNIPTTTKATIQGKKTSYPVASYYQPNNSTFYQQQNHPYNQQPSNLQRRPHEWSQKAQYTEVSATYNVRTTYDSVQCQSIQDPNKIKTERIKSIDSPKREPVLITEPIRTNCNINNNMPKPVDQSVISKLRNNLEMKVIEKQKTLKNQSSSEKIDDEPNKSDIASIIAARIRTKGELKGYTPIPIETKQLPKESPPEVVQPTDETLASKVKAKESDSPSAFDLMDWGSTCNDFLEQLQKSGGKKTPAAQRRFKLDKSDNNDELEEVLSTFVQDIKLLAENIIKPDEQSNSIKSNSQVDESSSDEDKPLHLLRQQSLTDSSKNRKDSSSNECEERTKCVETLSTSKSRRTAILTMLSEKVAKNMMEKQCNKRADNEKRTSVESSSDSENERNTKRSKKIIRKPRTRSSISIKENDDDYDSDTANTYTPSKNGKSTKKRGRKVKSSSESDIDANRNSKKKKSLELNSDTEDEDDVIPAHKVKKKTVVVKVEETMTRSKRKRELEYEIANSKVLRNDKMIKYNSVAMDKKSTDSKSTTEKRTNSKTSEPSEKGNSNKNTGTGKQQQQQRTKSYEGKKKNIESDADDLKSPKKNIREMKSQISSSSDSKNESSSSEAETIITERLRSRKSKLINNKLSNESNKHEKEKISSSSIATDSVEDKVWNRKSNTTTPKKAVTELDVSEESRSKFRPGWEEQAYEFKRSLKIPPRLISIGRPSWVAHRKSTSLPDLDPQHSSDASETFSEINKKYQTNMTPARKASRKNKSNEKGIRGKSTLTTNDTATIEDLKSKSIIDLLHQRVIRPTGRNKKSRHQYNQNEPKILPQSNEVELLPTPGSEGTNVFKPDNVFETAVLKSRTRKEYKAMKNQEIIREVFGGEDRPASAPPYNFEVVKQQQPVKPLTFDQQYEQYLEKMNVDYGEKIRKVKNVTESKNVVAELGHLIPKIEKMDDDSLLNQDDESHDTELNECERNADDIKEEVADSMERGDTPSVFSEIDGATPTSFMGVLKTKKGRGNRHGRRKGSSGFDYIRKKKKPLPLQTNPDGTPIIVKRRSAAVNYLEFKNEDDIIREIRSWVLNKGVGESVLHKAARLGYIDVIVYCLERMEMPPDQKDNAGYTPLHEACSRGLIDIARVLLQYGANHSETAHSGIRPLHEAVDNGYLEIVRLLLSHGADPLLATYAGQTPIMLAEDDDEMVSFLKNYLYDVQNTGPNKLPWKFNGPWQINDPDDIGYDVFDDVVDETETSQKAAKLAPAKSTTTTMPIKSEKGCRRKSPSRQKSQKEPDAKTENGECSRTGEQIANEQNDSDTELFEIEESDAPLIPTYHLRDEGSVKWVLLSDLCYLLKVKSKDTLLKQLCPGSSPTSSANQKDLLRELKMSEFLERATCLQLLCAGEKLNIRSSKVTLVKYNESVKNLLGVKTLLIRL